MTLDNAAMDTDPTLDEIRYRQAALESHPVFNAIEDIDDLRSFMSCHVFAVWDFMCLAKRLQRELTSVEPLWLPPDYRHAARLINEIILGEESDELPDGGSISHFELYLLAMQEVGASTQQIGKFISALRMNIPVDEALTSVAANPYIRNFVNRTIHTATHGTLFQVLGSFFYGREHVIPHMFERLLNDWHIDENDAPMFVYYLRRHIELDGDAHGPAARELIEQITRGQPEALEQLHLAALDAINDRIDLWDGLKQAISPDRPIYSSGTR
jgi:hypothetical protein